MEAIWGAERIIDKHHPALMVEVYAPYCMRPVADVFEYLMGRKGYRCFYYADPQGLIECKTVLDCVSAVENLHHLHDGDFLFV